MKKCGNVITCTHLWNPSVFLGCWTEVNGTFCHYGYQEEDCLLFLTHKNTQTLQRLWTGPSTMEDVWTSCSGTPGWDTPSHRTIHLFAFVHKMFQTNYCYLFCCFLLSSILLLLFFARCVIKSSFYSSISIFPVYLIRNLTMVKW